MEQILLVVHVFIAVALIGVVLIQRSESDGFGLGSGSGANFLSGRQAASLITRTTAILATLFILNSLVLSIMAANRANVSLVDQIEAAEQISPANPVIDEGADENAQDGDAAETDAPAVPLAE